MNYHQILVYLNVNINQHQISATKSAAESTKESPKESTKGSPTETPKESNNSILIGNNNNNNNNNNTYSMNIYRNILLSLYCKNIEFNSYLGNIYIFGFIQSLDMYNIYGGKTNIISFSNQQPDHQQNHQKNETNKILYK